jgi:hypothetical protein
VTATVPAQPASEDIDRDRLRDLVRAGVVGSWHYRWPELTAVAARLGLRPDDAVYRAHDGGWSPNRKPAATAADHIREANTR